MLCNNCKLDLDIELFRKRRRVCKKCENIDRQDRYYMNKEKEIARIIKYKNENHEKILEFRKKYREKYRERVNLISRKLYRIRVLLKINTFIYDDLIGCTPHKLRKWFEYNFLENMNWDNYGKVWQIDHINPCSQFDLDSDKNINLCFNWKNLRPCEKIENIKKQNLVDNELIKSYNKKSKLFETIYLKDKDEIQISEP